MISFGMRLRIHRLVPAELVDLGPHPWQLPFPSTLLEPCSWPTPPPGLQLVLALFLWTLRLVSSQLGVPGILSDFLTNLKTFLTGMFRKRKTTSLGGNML